MLNLNHRRLGCCEKPGPEADVIFVPANNFQRLPSFGEDLRATDNH